MGVRVFKIPHIFRELRSGRVKRGLKNLSYLTVGKISSQVIGFLGMIYMARYLGPDRYGIYVTVTAFVGMFRILALPGLRRVVIRSCSKDLDNAEKVLSDTVGLQSLFIFIAITAMLVTSFFTDYETTTKLYIAIFSLYLFSRSSKRYLNTIFKSFEKMQYIAIFQIFNRVVFVFFVILFLSLGYGLFTVVLITVGVSFVDMVLRFIYSRKIAVFDVFSKLKFDKETFKSSITFSGLSAFSKFYSSADLFMLSLLGTSPEVAIYGVAYRIASEGKVLKKLVSEGFFPIVVKTFDEKSVSKKIVIKYTLISSAAILLLAIIGVFVADPVIVFLFGEEYLESAHIFRVLIFYVVIWFSTIFFKEAAYATGNERGILIAKGVMAGLNIPLNIIFYSIYGVIGIAYSSLLVFTIGAIMINAYSYYVLSKQEYIT